MGDSFPALKNVQQTNKELSDRQESSNRQDSAWTLGNETLRDSVDYSSPAAQPGEKAGNAPPSPRSWRAYMVLLSGFLMMMNCW